MSKKVFSFQWFSVQKEVTPSVLNTDIRTLKTCAGFTLFEVLIALGVFAIAVTGLATALDSAVMAAFEARGRALSRMMLESRLSAALSDPPLNGRRVIEARDNNGVRVEETMEKFEAKTTNGTLVPGLWKLKVTADWGNREQGKETAEILLYRP